MTARIGRRVAENFGKEGEVPGEGGGTHLGKYPSVVYDSYLYLNT
jgi:hypothetical protein